MTESGLHIWDKLPIIAASPDGHVNEFGDAGLLEIKCPFSGKMMATIPDYYIDQVFAHAPCNPRCRTVYDVGCRTVCKAAA